MPIITPHIPEGLIDFMKTLAKSVLKEQPENIYEFAAVHFEKLLLERDNRNLNKGYEKFKTSEKYLEAREKCLLSQIKNNRQEKKKPEPITFETKTDLENAIPEILSPRSIHNKIKPRKLSSKKSSEILLAIKEEDESSIAIDDVNVKNTENSAAIKIQKVFRDYMKRRKQDKIEKTESEDSKKSLSEDAAALIIQRTLRKLFGSKKMKNKNSSDNNLHCNISGSLESNHNSEQVENNPDKFHKDSSSNTKRENCAEMDEKVKKELSVTIPHETSLENEKYIPDDVNINPLNTQIVDSITETKLDEDRNEDITNSETVVLTKSLLKTANALENVAAYNNSANESINSRQIGAKDTNIHIEPAVSIQQNHKFNTYDNKEVNQEHLHIENIKNSDNNTAEKVLKDSQSTNLDLTLTLKSGKSNEGIETEVVGNLVDNYDKIQQISETIAEVIEQNPLTPNSSESKSSNQNLLEDKQNSEVSLRDTEQEIDQKDKPSDNQEFLTSDSISTDSKKLPNENPDMIVEINSENNNFTEPILKEAEKSWQHENISKENLELVSPRLDNGKTTNEKISEDQLKALDEKNSIGTVQEENKAEKVKGNQLSREVSENILQYPTGMENEKLKNPNKTEDLSYTSHQRQAEESVIDGGIKDDVIVKLQSNTNNDEVKIEITECEDGNQEISENSEQIQNDSQQHDETVDNVYTDGNGKKNVWYVGPDPIVTTIAKNGASVNENFKEIHDSKLENSTEANSLKTNPSIVLCKEKNLIDLISPKVSSEVKDVNEDINKVVNSDFENSESKRIIEDEHEIQENEISTKSEFNTDNKVNNTEMQQLNNGLYQNDDEIQQEKFKLNNTALEIQGSNEGKMSFPNDGIESIKHQDDSSSKTKVQREVTEVDGQIRAVEFKSDKMEPKINEQQNDEIVTEKQNEFHNDQSNNISNQYHNETNLKNILIEKKSSMEKNKVEGRLTKESIPDDSNTKSTEEQINKMMELSTRFGETHNLEEEQPNQNQLEIKKHVKKLEVYPHEVRVYADAAALEKSKYDNLNRPGTDHQKNEVNLHRLEAEIIENVNELESKPLQETKNEIDKSDLKKSESIHSRNSSQEDLLGKQPLRDENKNEKIELKQTDLQETTEDSNFKHPSKSKQMDASEEIAVDNLSSQNLNESQMKEEKYIADEEDIKTLENYSQSEVNRAEDNEKITKNDLGQTGINENQLINEAATEIPLTVNNKQEQSSIRWEDAHCNSIPPSKSKHEQSSIHWEDAYCNSLPPNKSNHSECNLEAEKIKNSNENIKNTDLLEEQIRLNKTLEGKHSNDSQSKLLFIPDKNETETKIHKPQRKEGDYQNKLIEAHPVEIDSNKSANGHQTESQIKTNEDVHQNKLELIEKNVSKQINLEAEVNEKSELHNKPNEAILKKSKSISENNSTKFIEKTQHVLKEDEYPLNTRNNKSDHSINIPEPSNSNGISDTIDHGLYGKESLDIGILNDNKNVECKSEMKHNELSNELQEDTFAVEGFISGLGNQDNDHDALDPKNISKDDYNGEIKLEHSESLQKKISDDEDKTTNESSIQKKSLDTGIEIKNGSNVESEYFPSHLNIEGSKDHYQKDSGRNTCKSENETEQLENERTTQKLQISIPENNRSKENTTENSNNLIANSQIETNNNVENLSEDQRNDESEVGNKLDTNDNNAMKQNLELKVNLNNTSDSIQSGDEPINESNKNKITNSELVENASEEASLKLTDDNVTNEQTAQLNQDIKEIQKNQALSANELKIIESLNSKLRDFESNSDESPKEDKINMIEEDEPNVVDTDVKLSKIVASSSDEDHQNPEYESKSESNNRNIKSTKQTNIEIIPISGQKEEAIEEPCTKRSYAHLSTSDIHITDNISDAETTRAESRSTITDDLADIENVDISTYGQDSLEAMYYSLRKNEIMLDRMQKRAFERKSASKDREPIKIFDEQLRQVKSMDELQKMFSVNSEDDVIVKTMEMISLDTPSNKEILGDEHFENPIAVAAKNTEELLKRLHESKSSPICTENDYNSEEEILVSRTVRTYSPSIRISSRIPTPVKEYPKSVSFESPLQFSHAQSQGFIEQLHGMSHHMENLNNILEQDKIRQSIHQTMFESSISETDSDYCEIPEEKTNAIHDDFNISTALETASTDTDSTIISAATKIQAGARGFLTRRRLRRASVGAIPPECERKASFGNEAIGESLEDLIEQEAATKIQKSYQRYLSKKATRQSDPVLRKSSEVSISPKSGSDEDKILGITEIKLEQKSISVQIGNGSDANIASAVVNKASEDVNVKTPDVTNLRSSSDDGTQCVTLEGLNLAARRLTLQRGDAVQKDSTPEEDNNSAAGGLHSSEGGDCKTCTSFEKRKSSNLDMWRYLGPRQRTMPVQIDSEIFRILPKHMRKRIKSANVRKNDLNDL